MNVIVTYTYFKTDSEMIGDNMKTIKLIQSTGSIEKYYDFILNTFSKRKKKFTCLRIENVSNSKFNLLSPKSKS